MILVVASEVVGNVPQLAAAGPYLPTHWWFSFVAVWRAPVDTSTLLRGLLSFAAYTLIFGDFAWARFTSADVTQLNLASWLTCGRERIEHPTGRG